ncbi:KUP/HAK/KT family potassium transporter [Candidatus Saccharibacteria bacterium]|nr:KUP/HAK/KT family potassium transporter [Candidatus Saccharibacteria bacterium]
MSKTSKKIGLFGLSLGALGVVYGDIGTSPLYAVNEILLHANGNRSTEFVLGAISTVFWALTIIVSLKYVLLVLRADNDGEGGVFSLFAQLRKYKKPVIGFLTTALVLAAGLLFGDGLITPAISVLSAVEGLKVAAPGLEPFVIPITLAILTGLFAIQSKGTSVVGKLFGPIILVWFISIGLLGFRQIMIEPGVLAALNPYHVFNFFRITPIHEIFLTLGSVMLVVTGGEALFADMGHFGKKPIRISWFSVVYPMLILAYLGQGAFLLSSQKVVGQNVFFSMVPEVILIPMVILATFATIIASQALISGAFSLTSQGIALGYLPKLKIINTSSDHQGQIYVPAINWLLYFGCIVLVITFGSSSKLAAAYGLAVAIDMVLTSLCMIVLSNLQWKWPKIASAGVFGSILLIEITFLAANSLKFLQGGYVPIEIAVVGFAIMSTWRWGRKHIAAAGESNESRTMQEILDLKKKGKTSFPRSVLMLTAKEAHESNQLAPHLLNMFVDRYHILPDHLIILTVAQLEEPYIEEDDRYKITIFENDEATNSSMISITANFGYMETPNLERTVQWISENKDLTSNDDMKDWLIYVSKERLIIDDGERRHHKIRYSLFKLLARNAEPTFSAYGLGEDSRISMELVPVKIVS